MECNQWFIKADVTSGANKDKKRESKVRADWDL